MNFERLEVWKRSAKLSADLYIQLKDLKDYGFKDQITRSGLSVLSNIAEGMVRVSNTEKRRFINIAQGSIAELKTQLWIGIRITYIPKDIGNRLIEETKEISSMLGGLYRSIPTDS